MNKIGLFFCLVLGLPASAQILVEEPVEPSTQSSREARPRVGKDAATDYFKQRNSGTRKVERSTPRRMASAASGERVLGIHVGTFLNDTAYRWGRSNKIEEPAKGSIGVTYRVGEWTNSMDLFIRAELFSYDVDDEKPVKLSLMPIVAFPDGRSDFPLYFGAGGGVGVFFKQAGDESDLSFDYAVIVGARFPDLFESGGLFFETGLKGQVHLLSSGQHDGIFLAAGGLFVF